MAVYTWYIVHRIKRLNMMYGTIWCLFQYNIYIYKKIFTSICNNRKLKNQEDEMPIRLTEKWNIIGAIR